MLPCLLLLAVIGAFVLHAVCYKDEIGRGMKVVSLFRPKELGFTFLVQSLIGLVAFLQCSWRDDYVIASTTGIIGMYLLLALLPLVSGRIKSFFLTALGFGLSLLMAVLGLSLWEGGAVFLALGFGLQFAIRVRSRMRS